MYIITSLQLSCGSFNHQIITRLRHEQHVASHARCFWIWRCSLRGHHGGALHEYLAGHEYLSKFLAEISKKKRPEQIVSVEGSRGREREATSFSFHGVFSSLAKFTWFQADPANFNKQPIIWKGCSKVGMRMGQWAETEVIFIIYIIWFTLNILKLQVVLWQDVREQQQTHLKDAWRITR